MRRLLVTLQVFIGARPELDLVDSGSGVLVDRHARHLRNHLQLAVQVGELRVNRAGVVERRLSNRQSAISPARFSISRLNARRNRSLTCPSVT